MGKTTLRRTLANQPNAMAQHSSHCTRIGLLLLAFVVLTQLPASEACIPMAKVKSAVSTAVSKVTDTIKNIKNKITAKPPKPKYIGCYEDRTDGNRDVQFIGGRRNDMTTSLCNEICKEKHPMTKYFATQNGNICFCGNDYGEIGVKTDGFCDKPCAGDSNEKCGGDGMNSIYEIMV